MINPRTSFVVPDASLARSARSASEGRTQRGSFSQWRTRSFQGGTLPGNPPGEVSPVGGLGTTQEVLGTAKEVLGTTRKYQELLRITKNY